MGVREALWLIGLALVGYSVWQFFRALRAPRSSAAVPTSGAGSAEIDAPRAGAAPPPGDLRTQPIGQGVEAEAPSEVEDEDEDTFDDYAPLPGPQLGSDPTRAQGPSERLPAQPGVVQPDVFQMELDNSRLRQALQAQRDLVALQQDEIDRLVHDITELQDELARVREQPTSSPEYSEALVLAAQGLNAEMIAARCGISLAEAELVLSLARRGEGAA